MSSSPRDREIRLAASVAQEVRSALASILFSADFLDAEGSSMSLRVWQETLSEIGEVTRRLQLTADSLLDHAGLGPVVVVPVALRTVLARTQALLHAFYREPSYALRVELPAEEVWLRGNPLTIEQALLQVVMATADCTGARCVVQAVAASSRLMLWFGAEEHTTTLPELPPALADVARWAASQGGALELAREEMHALFCLELVRAEAAR